tara:strand:+ start:79 stop:636 length:558 start_codon:yes stop_codon:yes gene_type:complete
MDIQNNQQRYCENCICQNCIYHNSVEIEGYENYRIFKDGRVWSKIGKGRFLKVSLNTCGYQYVKLVNNKQSSCKTIHRLIAEHYIPNPDNKPFIDHINRIRDDNRIENLRWVTNQENCQNRNKSSVNTSGHKNISYNKQKDKWIYRKEINEKKIFKQFNSLNEALVFKFIQIIKYNSNDNTRTHH